VRLRRRQLRLLDGQHQLLLPQGEKGNALALNAGLGNLGVSVMQFLVPLVITAGVFGCRSAASRRSTEGGDALWLQNAGFIWVPFILASAFAAWFGMNDIADPKALPEQAVIFQRKHNWIMCWLYTGTFGSFIGFSAGFPLLPRSPVPGRQRAAIRLPRSAGRAPSPAPAPAGCPTIGGGRVTFWVFVGMMIGVSACSTSIGIKGSRRLPDLLRQLPAAVLRHRRRQCLHLPDDPGDHAQGNAAADAGPPRPTAPQVRQGIGGHHRLHLGHRRLWRLLHPQGLRHLDRHDRRAPRRALGLPAFYVTCLAITWVVYTRRGGLLHDIERGRRAARRPSRRITACIEEDEP
jgi:NNP family nitrate/nitrite transporter-like MFS transporter